MEMQNLFFFFSFLKLWNTFPSGRKRISSTAMPLVSFGSSFLLPLPFLYFEIKGYFKLKISKPVIRIQSISKIPPLFPAKLNCQIHTISACCTCRNTQFHQTTIFQHQIFCKETFRWRPNPLFGTGNQAGAEVVQIQWIFAKHKDCKK